jgi:hypothetical protein
MATQIKSQQFAEVLAVLLAPKLPGAGAEKRRATRIACEATLTVWPVVDGSPKSASTVLSRDISYSGIGLLQGKEAKVGDQFILKLPRAKADPILVLCQVTFARTLADNIYTVGASFMSILQSSKDIKPAAPAEIPAPSVPIPADALEPSSQPKEKSREPVPA